MQTIRINDPLLQTMGRIAREDDCAHFIWTGSCVFVRFRGSELKVDASFHCIWGSNSLGIVVDGRLSRIPVKPENNNVRMTVQLAGNLAPEKEHNCIIFKQLDCSYDYRLYRLETDGEFLQSPPLPRRKLEFYGDSVTAGAAVECVDYVGLPDPSSNDSSYDNSWHSYAWQAARKMNAQVHLIAQGGIAVFTGTGYFHYPATIGMEETWNRLCYFPEAGEYTEWDFSQYTPDAVVFAIAQNDQHDPSTDSNPYTVSDPAYRTKWKDGYRRIIQQVAEKYPAGTQYVCITTVLMHDPCWDDAIDEVVNELRNEGLSIHHFLFRRNGAATAGHPRIPEQTEMADELSAYLETLLKS